MLMDYKLRWALMDNQWAFGLNLEEEDHAMGITRLNVYAGLVGFYEIIDPEVSI